MAEDSFKGFQEPLDSGESIDDLLARLSYQETVIKEQRQELETKNMEVSELRLGKDQTGKRSREFETQDAMAASKPNMGTRGISANFESRLASLGGVPEPLVQNGDVMDPGESTFVQEQINKHTFNQAVDPDFYTDDNLGPETFATIPGISNDARQALVPPGQGFPVALSASIFPRSGSSIWNNDPRPKPMSSGLAPVMPQPMQPYWQQYPIGTGYIPRVTSSQDKLVPDWKTVGSESHRRANSGTSSSAGFSNSPGRQVFSPSPLSPAFVPSVTSSAWNSTGNTAATTLSSTTSYSTMPYGGYIPAPDHEYAGVSQGNTHYYNSSNVPSLGASSSAPPTSYGGRGEQINYRRMVERGQHTDWNFVVEQVVVNNDQQGSIFLQQKLKGNTSLEVKLAIVDAITAQAHSLMTNRFGNFLVQRCFEHGEPYHIEAITKAIKGRVIQLSMDAFGCHVIQKAFDCIDENFKLSMVQELLRRIPETVSHRYACHVWQKLFELRWIGTPPQIMKYVNEALAGLWPDVALGETGSLVVQNIFENCLEEDKRPCINEVLANLDIIAHGQFGNWCIQHICEHGSPMDRSVAIDQVLCNSAEYSMDQYASKVVEKCLKCGGPEFVDRYLERVCEGRPDRPRIPLIDIASDQYGNYLIQHILQTAPVPLREIVAAHIRKHMVSLRGSKFGSRVGMLCINHNYLNYQPRGHGTTNVNNGHGAHGGGSISGGAGHRHGNSNRWGYR